MIPLPVLPSDLFLRLLIPQHGDDVKWIRSDRCSRVATQPVDIIVQRCGQLGYGLREYPMIPGVLSSCDVRPVYRVSYKVGSSSLRVGIIDKKLFVW